MRRERACLAAGAMLATLAGPALAQTAPDRPEPAKPAAAAKPVPPGKSKPGSKVVAPVVVTGGRAEVETSIDRKSYDITKDLQAQNGSIADALRNLPSVDVDVQGNLSLRGDSNVTILVDGKPAPQFEGRARADALQQLPADQIERVEVITNPGAALNPEGSGGVINLISKKSRGAGITGTAAFAVGSSSVRRGSLLVGYNSPKLSVTANVTGNYQRNKQHGVDVRSTLDPASGQFLDHDDLTVGRNIQRGPFGRLSATYTPNPKDQLTAAGSAGEFLQYGHPYDSFTDEAPGGGIASFLVRQGHRRFDEIDTGLSAGWRHTFAEGHTLSLDLVHNTSRPREDILYATFAASPAPAFTLEDTRSVPVYKHSEVRLAYVRPVAGGTLSAGYELRYDDPHFDYSDARGTSEANIAPLASLANVFGFDQIVHSGYATYERAFGDLAVKGGLRLEEVRLDLDQETSGQRISQDYVKAYPSLHVSWKLDDTRKLTASLSHRVQRPPAQFLNPRVFVRDAFNFQAGNANLKPQDTSSYELGYEQRVDQATYIATLFYRDNKHEFTQALVPLGGSVFETTILNEGTSRAVGLELTANGKLTKTLSFNVSATPYWATVDSGDPAFGGARQTFTANGRGSLNWQATKDDLLQLNATGRGNIITAQGFLPPVWTLNFGWRHKLSDRVTATLTAQDIAGSNRFELRFDTPTLHERLNVQPVSRAVLFRLDYRFGGPTNRAQQQPDFQYDNAPQPGPPG